MKFSGSSSLKIITMIHECQQWMLTIDSNYNESICFTQIEEFDIQFLDMLMNQSKLIQLFPSLTELRYPKFHMSNISNIKLFTKLKSIHIGKNDESHSVD